jgi:hypothetical protein
MVMGMAPEEKSGAAIAGSTLRLKLSLDDRPHVSDRGRADLGFGLNALQGARGGRLDLYRDAPRILLMCPFALRARDPSG